LSQALLARDRKIKNKKKLKVSELQTFLTVIPNQLYVYTVTVVTEHVVILVASSGNDDGNGDNDNDGRVGIMTV